ncbi:MAG: hypothetical protein ABUJ92_11070 [Desulfobacterales bacterium]
MKPLVPEPDIVAPARKTPPEMAEEHKIASATIPPDLSSPSVGTDA